MQARRVSFALPLVWLVMLNTVAEAVIKIEFPVSRIYRDAKTVRSATVIGLDVEKRVIEVKPTVTFKGGVAPDRLRLEVSVAADWFSRVATNEPVLIFASETDGKGAALMHLADTWVLAQGGSDSAVPVWRVVQPYDAKRAYPGRTAGLVRLIAAMKAGQNPMEDKIDPACFSGSIRELGSLGIRPTFLEAADVTGDRRVDLLAGTADGVRLFSGGATNFADVTASWGLQGITARHVVAGDVNGDGLADLLLGKTLLLRQGDKFVRAAMQSDLPADVDWLAAAMGDVDGDRAVDVMVLLKSGELVVVSPACASDKPGQRSLRRLWDGGAAAVVARFAMDWGESNWHVMVVRGNDVVRYAVAPGGGPASVFSQLAGCDWLPTLVVDGQPADAVKCVGVDCDGNGKGDFLLLAPSGGLTLLNRGFGVYYVDYTIHSRLVSSEKQKLPFRITPGACVAAGRILDGEQPRQNLLVLTEEGRLFEMQNPDPESEK